MHVDSPNGTNKGEILAEAIAATGGPNSDALAAVRNHVDARCPEFPWAKSWTAEIAGAKSAMRRQLGTTEPHVDSDASSGDDQTLRVFAGRRSDEAGTASATTDFVRWARDLQSAAELVERIGRDAGDELERSRAVLAYLQSLDGVTFDRLQDALNAWCELLDAVAGDHDTAHRVLDVLLARSQTAADSPAPALHSTPAA